MQTHLVRIILQVQLLSVAFMSDCSMEDGLQYPINDEAIVFAPSDVYSNIVEEDFIEIPYKNYTRFPGERNYAVPLNAKIITPFDEGQTIHIVGTIEEHARRFTVNFYNGIDESADIPLHLSFRFKIGGIRVQKIAYNVRKNKAWSRYEKKVNNPFVDGQQFDLRIRIMPNKYYIYADRKLIARFTRSLAIQNVSRIGIEGDLVNVRVIQYSGWLFHLPYSAKAPLTPGNRLDIGAYPKGKWFNVQLNGSNLEQHLNLTILFEQKYIITSVRAYNALGMMETFSEKGAGYPIKNDEMFDLTIISEEPRFLIWFNGELFTEVTRFTPGEVEFIELNG
ncbi:hypothetical protein AB6A40_005416, partial [Gnathostoma spinigerum]